MPCLLAAHPMQFAARAGASLRMRSTYVSAGGCSDLESLKSGKDRTKPWAFSLLMHSNERQRICTAS